MNYFYMFKPAFSHYRLLVLVWLQWFTKQLQTKTLSKAQRSSLLHTPKNWNVSTGFSLGGSVKTLDNCNARKIIWQDYGV